MNSYTFNTTGEDVASDCSTQIANKTVLITGVSPSGLGGAFASIIAKYSPACIILATRDISKAKEVAGEFPASVRTHIIELNLGSLQQIRKAAEEINKLEENIDVIVNNAGIMAPPYSKTIDGIESQLGINHIGHFLLTNLLLPKIIARKVPVRIVNVASNGFRFGPVRFEDYNFDVSVSKNCCI